MTVTINDSRIIENISTKKVPTYFSDITGSTFYTEGNVSGIELQNLAMNANYNLIMGTRFHQLPGFCAYPGGAWQLRVSASFGINKRLFSNTKVQNIVFAVSGGVETVQNLILNSVDTIPIGVFNATQINRRPLPMIVNEEEIHITSSTPPTLLKIKDISTYQNSFYTGFNFLKLSSSLPFTSSFNKMIDVNSFEAGKPLFSLASGIFERVTQSYQTVSLPALFMSVDQFAKYARKNLFFLSAGGKLQSISPNPSFPFFKTNSTDWVECFDNLSFVGSSSFCPAPYIYATPSASNQVSKEVYCYFGVNVASGDTISIALSSSLENKLISGITSSGFYSSSLLIETEDLSSPEIWHTNINDGTGNFFVKLRKTINAQPNLFACINTIIVQETFSPYLPNDL